ncbi:MAG: hypothetical protein ACK5KU_06625 [Beutenbergiaceae bacterium]
MNRAVLLAQAEAPDPQTVTPGVEGFIAFGVLALMMIFLVLNMSRHLRKIDARAAAQRAAEEAEEAATLRAQDQPQAKPE